MRSFSSLVVILLTITCLQSCIEGENVNPVQELLRSPAINNDSNSVFLVLYPADCPNCYGNANRHFNYLTNKENFPASNLFIVMPEVRQKVKDNFFSTILPFDTTQHTVIESTALIKELKLSLPPDETNSSFLVVYSADKKCIGSEKLKMISSHEDLLKLIR